MPSTWYTYQMESVKYLFAILVVFGIAFKLCACETPAQTAIRTQCGPSATASASRTIFSKKFDFSDDCRICCPKSLLCCLFSSNDAVLPLINKCNDAGGFGDLQSNISPVPVNPPNDQYRCKPEFNCTVPCGSNQYSIPGSSTCNDCPKPCIGLIAIKSSTLQGNQVVVNKNFAKYMQGLIDCAQLQHFKLHVDSTSRCRKPGNNTLAVDRSDHALGMATDSQPVINGKLISREDMNRAWCAFNAHVKDPCKDKYGIHMPPQNDVNKSIYGFLKCAINSGLSAGVAYKGQNSDGTFKQDGNHFQRGRYSEAAKQNYQKLLKKFCNSQCPKVQKGQAGQYACDCAGY